MKNHNPDLAPEAYGYKMITKNIPTKIITLIGTDYKSSRTVKVNTEIVFGDKISENGAPENQVGTVFYIFPNKWGTLSIATPDSFTKEGAYDTNSSAYQEYIETDIVGSSSKYESVDINDMTFPPKFQGTWYSYSAQKDEYSKVTINDKKIVGSVIITHGNREAIGNEAALDIKIWDCLNDSVSLGDGHVAEGEIDYKASSAPHIQVYPYGDGGMYANFYKTKSEAKEHD
jgi:hypothetical protein